ncbi:MAG: HD domain-containing phosphohydrolase [Nitrospinaceae bacterium]
MGIEPKAKRILCIDDDAASLKIIRQILTGSFPPETLEIHEAPNGVEGLELIKKLQPDFVLSDIQMPDLDGFQLCREIREGGIHATVILMSAYDALEDYAFKARGVGADAFLSKPVKKGELLLAVNFVLRLASLNEAVITKNTQLEKSLDQLKQFHQKLTVLNEELKDDKRRMSDNLKDMVALNSQLEAKNSQIQTMNVELTNRFDSTVSLLANIIELHQSQHRGHAERVAEASVFVAGKMGLTEQQTLFIKTAARLHELGIVSLPGDKLIEVGTDEAPERKFTNHPLVAEVLLKSFPGFELVSNIIRHLHENVDGTGTPDGLAGDRIPIGSRIISAASFFDHTAVAHKAMTPMQVFALLEEKGGLLFDEKVVSILEDHVRAMSPDVEKTIECNVFGLREGMRLAADIYSESGINLLRKGTILNRDTLSRILKFNNVDPIAGVVKVKQT